MEVSDHTLFFAFRYALGRMSTAPSIVADDLKRNWDEFEPSTKKLIKEEIIKAIEDKKVGMKMDEETWQEILKLEVKNEF